MRSERNTQRMIHLAVVLSCGLTIALAVTTIVVSDESISRASLSAVAVLGLLTIATTNSDLTVRAGLGISGNAMVLIGSLVVFRAYGFFLGPLLVGCFGALDYKQLREGAWEKIAFNASADGLALLAAGSSFWIATIEPNPSTLTLCFATLVSATIYLCVHAPMISIPVALSRGESYQSV